MQGESCASDATEQVVAERPNSFELPIPAVPRAFNPPQGCRQFRLLKERGLRVHMREVRMEEVTMLPACCSEI
jgi:hypothetical protein